MGTFFCALINVSKKTAVQEDIAYFIRSGRKATVQNIFVAQKHQYETMLRGYSQVLVCTIVTKVCETLRGKRHSCAIQTFHYIIKSRGSR